VRNYHPINTLTFIQLCLAKRPNLSLRNKRGLSVLLSTPVPTLQPVFDRQVLISRQISEFFSLIDVLLTAGSSISEIDSEGNTLLHRVCQLMLVDEHLQTMIQGLVRRGAPIHAKNARGLNILAQVLVKIDIERNEKIGNPVTYQAKSVSSGAAALFPDNEHPTYAETQEDPIHES